MKPPVVVLVLLGIAVVSIEATAALYNVYIQVDSSSLPTSENITVLYSQTFVVPYLSNPILASSQPYAVSTLPSAGSVWTGNCISVTSSFANDSKVLQTITLKFAKNGSVAFDGEIGNSVQSLLIAAFQNNLASLTSDTLTLTSSSIEVNYTISVGEVNECTVVVPETWVYLRDCMNGKDASCFSLYFKQRSDRVSANFATFWKRDSVKVLIGVGAYILVALAIATLDLLFQGWRNRSTAELVGYLIGNFFWIAGGFAIVECLFFLLLGSFLCATYVFIPLGRRCLKIAQLALHPFSRKLEVFEEVVEKEGSARNVGPLFVWIFFAGGIFYSAFHFVLAFLSFATIVLFPFGLQHLKLARFCWNPVSLNPQLPSIIPESPASADRPPTVVRVNENNQAGTGEADSDSDFDNLAPKRGRDGKERDIEYSKGSKHRDAELSRSSKQREIEMSRSSKHSHVRRV